MQRATIHTSQTTPNTYKVQFSDNPRPPTTYTPHTTFKTTNTSRTTPEHLQSPYSLHITPISSIPHNPRPLPFLCSPGRMHPVLSSISLSRAARGQLSGPRMAGRPGLDSENDRPVPVIRPDPQRAPPSPPSHGIGRNRARSGRQRVVDMRRLARKEIGSGDGASEGTSARDRSIESPRHGSLQLSPGPRFHRVPGARSTQPAGNGGRRPARPGRKRQKPSRAAQ